MNVFGNSLKFTNVRVVESTVVTSYTNVCLSKDGFVHVVLRQLPHSDEDPPNKVKVELAVLDTGKVWMLVWFLAESLTLGCAIFRE